MNRQSWGEGRSYSEAVSVTRTDASSEEQLSVERLGGGEGLVRGQGQRGINISYARLGRGHSVLWWWKRRIPKWELAQILRK